MKKGFKGFWVYLVILALVLGMVSMIDMKPKEKIEPVSYTAFVNYIADEDVKKIEFKELKMTAELKDGKKIETYAHSSLDMDRLHREYLDEQSKKGIVTLTNAKPEEPSLLVSLLPTLIMIAVLVFFRKEIFEIIKALYFGLKDKKYDNSDFKTGIYILLGTIITVKYKYLF